MIAHVRPAVLSLALLAVLAACGVPPETRAQTRAAGQRDRVLLREEIRADCMKEKGFKFVAFVSSYINPIRRDSEEVRARESGDYLAMRRFREKYGFGVFSLYAYPKEFGNPTVKTDAPLDPNLSIQGALSRTQREAYRAADDACYRRAIKEITGKDVDSFFDQAEQANALIERRVSLEIDGDPRLVRLGAKMGNCLRGKGYAVDSTEPSALAQRGHNVFHAEENSLGEKAPDALRPEDMPKDAVYAPDLTPDQARPYLAREIRAALDDLECGKRFYPSHEPAYGKIQREVYLEFGFYEGL